MHQKNEYLPSWENAKLAAIFAPENRFGIVFKLIQRHMCIRELCRIDIDSLDCLFS